MEIKRNKVIKSQKNSTINFKSVSKDQNDVEIIEFENGNLKKLMDRDELMK